MTAKELLNILNELSEDELNLDVQLVASGTRGRPIYDDIGVQVDTDEFDSARKVLRFDID